MNFEKPLLTVFIYGYSILFDITHNIAGIFFGKMGERRKWDIFHRQHPPSPVRDFRNRSVVWLHAASLGETKLLYKFLEVLEQRHPGDLYLVTATSRTGVQFLERHKPSSVCGVGYLPFDSLTLMNATLKQYGIKRVWLLETELWPSMLWACKKKKIPVGIVNARMEIKSFKRYFMFRKLLAPLFSVFDIVFAQTEEYAERFVNVGVSREIIHVVGNIKGHIYIKRPSKRDWLSLRRGMNLGEGSFVLTAGCVHAGEGKEIRKCIDMLSRKNLPCKVIVVPRYLEEVPVIMDEIGGSIAHITEITTSRKWDVCIIEKMGILDEVYKIADAAFVGGTFVPVGAHNVWDPARFGIPVFFGPDYHTQIESCEKLLSAGVAFKVENGEELANSILKVIRLEPRKFVSAQTAFIETINKRQSVLEPLIP
ncbi:MAG: 3-deoxy-D-manno-octulosonic acid transferase [Fibrobacterota bacterium]|nr:glycosyltransferase N-terminal domain-containing protein [Chitinispirillaceae bacterium]